MNTLSISTFCFLVNNIPIYYTYTLQLRKGGNRMNKGDAITSLLGQTFNKLYLLNSIQEKEFLKDQPIDLHPSEIHCLEQIARLDEANVTKLADAFQMTKGGISKITKKLLQQGAIDSYQKAGNKKEIHFQLTVLGKNIVAQHAKLHALWRERDRGFYDQLTAEEQNTVLRFLEAYKTHLEAESEKIDHNAKK